MNPYLKQQAEGLQTSANQNLQQNILPGINTGSIASGGFGGSRQGIAQGLAIGNSQTGVANAQANLYGNAYNTDQQIQAQAAAQQAQIAAQQRIAEMQDATSRLGLQNNYNLGLGGLGLNYTGMNQNFYTAQRGQDLQAMGLGANLAQTGNQGLVGQGQQIGAIGQQQQQAPWWQLGQFGNALAPFSGLNQTNTQTTPGVSTLGSAAGGALTAAQLWQLLSGGKG
jgi:hypothetical protein